MVQLTPNKSLQHTFDPPPAFAAAKAGGASNATELRRQAKHMITAPKLDIYRKFDGDDDGWSRAGCPGGEMFADGDWVEIRNLLQELSLLKRGVTSADYAERIRQKLSAVTSDASVAEIMMDLA